MANQTFNPTTAKYLARVDGAPDPQPSARVTPVCPYDDNNESCPYDGNWKKTLLPNIGYHYKMRNGILEVYASKVGFKQITLSDRMTSERFCENHKRKKWKEVKEF